MRHGRKVLQIGLAVLALALLLTASLPSRALAQADSTTVGALSLIPAFENISVYSSFTGDDNENNQAALEYRKVGSTQWKSGIPMTVDRRDEISWFHEGVGTDYVANEYKNQWRAVIFWLEPNTDYEVRVTYTDPDGASGSPATGTTTTRNDNPASSGTTYYVATTGNDTTGTGTEVNPWLTIQHAADVVQAGDTVLIKPGMYAEQVDITTSGTANNYIVFQSYDANDKAIIDGGGSRPYNIDINRATHIRIRELELKSVTFANLRLYDEADDCIIEDNIIDSPGTSWGAAGIQVRLNADYARPVERVLIKGNTITFSEGVLGTRYENYGVFFWNGGGSGHVVCDNYIDGSGIFKDCIGGTPNNGVTGVVYKDSFIHDNECYGYWDDAIEIEGGNMCVAVWGNHGENTYWKGTNQGKMGMGMAPVTRGPMYVFRNTFLHFTDSGIKCGGSSAGFAYVYHNTFYSEYGNGFSHFGNDRYVDNFIIRNNIFRVGARVIYAYDYPTTNSFDYDNLFTTGTYFARWYNVRYENPDAFSEFQAGSGQEAHGIGDDPTSTFVDAANDDFRLQATSPCRNIGASLVGFNDANSPWPYSGSAPDIGAFEFTSGAPPGPLHHITVTPVSVSLEVGQSQQFSATGYDQYDNEIVGLSFTWSTDVGTIDENGLFTAQSTPGVSGYVKASVDAIEGQATVNITGGYTPGDANGDGNVDGLDITKVERIIMGLDDPTPGADANGDDNINTLDITQIELIIMGS